jgi:geranylgeranyl diphosphate synthase type I
MPFIDSLARYAAGVEAELSNIVDDMTARAARVHPVGVELVDVLSDLIRAPGKRMRPVLMWVAYEGLGGTSTSDAVRAFCALELLQSFLLIHDDVMDRSELRRGRPTVHREYATRYQGRVRDVDHFSQTMAILAGDVAGQQAMLLLSQSPCPPERINQAMTCYAEAVLDVCYGQALDILLSERPLEEVLEEEVLRVAEYKTARYSTELPLHLGAILAEADEQALDHLSAYAIPAGVAFQLQDDLLGTFGDQATTGKSAQSDLQEGKRTLLILRAWRNADAAQRDTLARALGNPDASAEDVRSAREVIESTGARLAAEEQMNELVRQAKTSLAHASFAPGMTQFLVDLADYVTNRTW